ncbi:MAG: hypothetical protein ACLRWQ_04535 [Flavonifractor plautii]
MVVPIATAMAAAACCWARCSTTVPRQRRRSHTASGHQSRFAGLLRIAGGLRRRGPLLGSLFIIPTRILM